jgi:hypothetical protein
MPTWDTAFEASPPDTGEDAAYGAERIRDTKIGARERLDVEHNFSNLTPNTGTGRHKPGKVSVAFEGTTAEINALTGMAQGCIAFDTDLNVFKVYSGAAWISRGGLDHGALAGLADDDHPQYLNLTKASQTITQNVGVAEGVTIDGRDISEDYTALSAVDTDLTERVVALESVLNTNIIAYRNANLAVIQGLTVIPYDTEV